MISNIIIGFLLISMIVLAIIRHLNNGLAEDRFIYRLYKIRDQIRRDAIDGIIEKDNKNFDFFDQTISILINESNHLTLFYIVSLSRHYENNKRYKKERKEFNKEILKNEYYSKVKMELDQALQEYVIDQSYVTLKVLNLVMAPFDYYKKKKAEYSKSLKNSVFLPEISAMSH